VAVLAVGPEAKCRIVTRQIRCTVVEVMEQFRRSVPRTVGSLARENDMGVTEKCSSILRPQLFYPLEACAGPQRALARVFAGTQVVLADGWTD
jgi:hypothetical protein